MNKNFDLRKNLYLNKMPEDNNLALGLAIGIVLVLLICVVCSCSGSTNDNNNPSPPKNQMVRQQAEPFFYDPTGSGVRSLHAVNSSVANEKARHDDSLRGGGYQGIRHLQSPHNNADGDYHMLNYSAYDGNSLKQIPRNMPNKYKMLDNDGLVYNQIQPKRSNAAEDSYGLHGSLVRHRGDAAQVFKGVL